MFAPDDLEHTVGDLGARVVNDVGLANAVEDDATERAHERSVNRGKGTSSKGPGLGRVVGDHGVGVLQVGDHDQPAANLSAESLWAQTTADEW